MAWATMCTSSCAATPLSEGEAPQGGLPAGPSASRRPQPLQSQAAAAAARLADVGASAPAPARHHSSAHSRPCLAHVCRFDEECRQVVAENLAKRGVTCRFETNPTK